MGYRLDGNTDNFLEVASSRIFTVTSDPRPIALSMWVRPASLSGNQAWYSNDSNANEPRVFLGHQSSNVRFLSTTSNFTTPSSVMTVDIWNHVAVRWLADGSINLFINGSSRATGTLSFTSGTATSTSRIGRIDAALFGWTGDCAEYAFWSGTLPSDSELAGIWTSAETGIRADALSVQPFRYNRFNGSLTDEKGGTAFSIVGTVNASGTIGSSPAHPIITSSPSVPSAATITHLLNN